MTDQKLSQLTVVTTLSDTAKLYAVDPASSAIAVPSLRTVIKTPDFRQASSNSGGAVTTTSGGATVLDVAIGAVAIGDRFNIFFQYRHVKGGTIGDTVVAIVKTAGTSTIVMGANETAIRDRFEQSATTTAERTMAGQLEVTGAGSLTIRATGTSLGSDGTVDTDRAQIVVEKIT